jgi:hypothetical protein
VDPLDALTAAERARLDRFAAAFDRLGAPDYAPLTPRWDAEADGAAEAARAHLASGARRRAVREAVTRFATAAARAYSDRLSLPDTFLVYQSLADRGDDRRRFLAALERAVVAVILWDELAEADLAALLGPWAGVVDRALGPAPGDR